MATSRLRWGKPTGDSPYTGSFIKNLLNAKQVSNRVLEAKKRAVSTTEHFHPMELTLFERVNLAGGEGVPERKLFPTK